MSSFGETLKKERGKRRLDQREFAKLIGVTQQTVSRWESDESKPRSKDIAKIAGIFTDIPVDDWRELSGRVSPPIRPLTDTLPLHELPPDKFELFCVDYVKALYPEAEVHRYGSQGHKQYGIDLYAVFPDKKVFSFQCKRRKKSTSFGPEKVSQAVKDTDFKANKYFILLTKTASTEARNEILKHKTKWVLDDIYDISGNIRRLPKALSLKLVETYFPNHTIDFLGEEPGPWVTAESYYSKFNGILRQDWQLIGREKELESLLSFPDSDHQIKVINGRGGIGKTKVLKDFTDEYSKINPKRIILFAISGISLETKDLKDLPDNAILVVDDTHERTDLTGFLNTISAKGLPNKVILVTRPYGLSRLRSNIANAGFYLKDESILRIDSLTIAETTELAKSILNTQNGNTKLAPTIANLSKDCPLITVTAAKIACENPDILTSINEDTSFHDEVLKRFYDSVTGDIRGTKLNELAKNLLEVISLIQPISPGQDNTTEVLAKILDSKEYLIEREIRYLEDAGILLKRRNQIRIVPDLLGDYIREIASYNNKENRSTKFFESIYPDLPIKLRNNLLVNLSQLDWRMSNGGYRSTLLDSIWDEIIGSFKRSAIWQRKEILVGLKEIAYYQPERMLEMVNYAVNHPTKDTGIDSKFGTTVDYGYVTKELPYILRDIAYNPEFQMEACDLLWKLSKGDNRARNSHPEHPLRVLTEMIAIRPNKPVAYSERILDQAINSWLKDTDYGVNAFEVIEKLLETADYETETIGFTMTMHPFFVSPEAADPLRKKIIDTAKCYLGSKDINIAARALRTISQALHYPRPIGGAVTPPELRKKWEIRIIDVLKQLNSIVVENKLDPILIVQILHDTSWHKDFSKSETKNFAVKIEKAMPKDLDFRITKALMDNWGWSFERDKDSVRKSRDLHSAWMKAIAKECIDEYEGNIHELIKLIEGKADKISSTTYIVQASHNSFISSLSNESTFFAQSLAEYVLDHPQSILIGYLNTAIAYLQKSSPDIAISICNKALIGGEQLERRVAIAFSWGMAAEEITKDENLQILQELINSKHDSVRLSVVKAVSRLATINTKLTTELITAIKFNGNENIADEVLTEFVHNATLSIKSLTSHDLDKIMDMLLECNSLGSYYVEGFLRELSATDPLRVIELFKNRIVRSTLKTDSEAKYNPLPHLFERSEPFRFNEHPDYDSLLIEVSNWVFEHRDKEEWQYEYFGKDLFKLMVGVFDDRVISLLKEWIQSNEKSGIENTAILLSEANSQFIWSNTEFIIDLINRSELFGRETLRKITSAIYSALISGSKTGTPGEPFPEDERMRDEAQKLLEALPRSTPAYKFFADVKATAERDIARSKEDRYI